MNSDFAKCLRQAARDIASGEASFMCHALTIDGGWREPFRKLAVERGVYLDGSLTCVTASGRYEAFTDYANDARDVRVLFLLFLAESIEHDT